MELLRKCKMVAIRGEPDFENTSDENVTQMKKPPKSNGLKPVKAIKPLGMGKFFLLKRLTEELFMRKRSTLRQE